MLLFSLFLEGFRAIIDHLVSPSRVYEHLMLLHSHSSLSTSRKLSLPILLGNRDDSDMIQVKSG